MITSVHIFAQIHTISHAYDSSFVCVVVNSDHKIFAEGEDLYGLLQKNNATAFVKQEDKCSKEQLDTFWTGEGKGTLNDHLARLEKLRGETGFTSTGKTIGEAYLLGMLYQLVCCKGDCLDAYPTLKAYYTKAIADPGAQKVVSGQSPMGEWKQYFLSYTA